MKRKNKTDFSMVEPSGDRTHCVCWLKCVHEYMCFCTAVCKLVHYTLPEVYYEKLSPGKN